MNFNTWKLAYFSRPAIIAIMLIIIPLFTLSSIYSTNASRAWVKNPKWMEANQLTIYKRGRGGFELGTTENRGFELGTTENRGFELGTTKNKSSWRSERDSNSGIANCKSSALTARPTRIHIFFFFHFFPKYTYIALLLLGVFTQGHFKRP